MKKFLLMLTLLFVMAGSVWSGTVQIGSGTTTTSYMPLYTCYVYNYSQQIYLASEITAGGGAAGNITKVRFYYNSGGTTYANWSNWTIYMGNTSQASFSSSTNWIPVGSMTQVFSGTRPTPVAGTWLEITLSTPFAWDGTSNVVIALDENSTGYSCTAYWRSYTASANRNILYYSDGTNPDPAAPPTANYGPNTTLSQIQFDMPTITPALTAVPTSLGFGIIATGNCSAEQTYSLSGINLTAGPIVVTAPTGFEVSLTSGSGFGPSVNVAYTPPTLSATPIYVRFCPTTDGAFSGNVTNVGGGASVNVAVTGVTSIFYAYCASGATNTADEEIYSVTLNGNNNALGCGVTAPGPGSIAYRYSNFMFQPSLANVAQGGTASFTVEENECDGATYYANGCAIWVDWNQDGDFLDADEKVFVENTTTASPRNIVGSFAVPATALLGETGMRVTVAEGLSGTGLTPCLSYGYGETEDYRITVVIAPSLSVVPGSLAFGSTPVGLPTAGQTFDLSGSNLAGYPGDIAVTAPSGFEIWDAGTSSWTNTINVPFTGATLAPVTLTVRFNPSTPGTDYSGNVTCVGGGASINVAVTGSTNYCTASAVCDEYISNVTIGAINNTTTCGTGGYTDWTALSTNMNQLASYAISVTNGLAYSGDLCTVWVDWNQDLSFDDPGETYVLSGGTALFTGTIAVPATASLGSTRMRVRLSYTDSPVPCGAMSYGETEDYTIVVDPAQIGTVQGYVFDQEGGCLTPLSGASVTIGLLSTLTDGTGFYSIDSVSIGTYSMVAGLTGWLDETVPGVVITLGGTTNQNFCLYPELLPPLSLNAFVTGPSLNDVHVQWAAPGSLPPEQWIQWDLAATPTNSIGTNGVADFMVASRWPVADISPYTGMFLKKIEFWPAVAPASCTYTIKVWTSTGYPASNPTEVYSYTMPSGDITISSWNVHTLPSGIYIDGTKELWFGYECNTTTGYPAGCDNGPQVVLKGNMILWGGVWYQLTDLNAALTYNWSIHGWLAQAAMAGPQLVLEEGVNPPPPAQNEGTLTVSNTITPLIATTGSSVPAGLQSQAAMMANQPPAPNAPLAPGTTFLGYNLYRTPALTPTNPVFTSNLFYDDLGLAKGQYCYEVAALYSYGESVKAGPVCVDVYTCFPPVNLAIPVATTTTTSALVTWDASAISPNPEWIYEYGPAGFVHGTGIGGQQYIDQDFITLNSLTPGTVYDFYVRTFCTIGDSSSWVKKTFRTHWWDNCPAGSTAEVEICGDTTNNGCNNVIPTFEPLACGETKCGTGWFDGGTRDTDWYEFTLMTETEVTWSGAAEFSYILGFIASPCPAVDFITYNTGNAGDTVTITATLPAGTYYAFAAPLFLENVVCDSLDMYFATLTCNTDIYPPVIANVVYTPVSCTPVDHNVSCDVTDDISINTVNIVWTVDGVAQADIPMVAGTPPQYTATIPAQAPGAVVAFQIEATDNAVPPNTGTSTAYTYQDAYLAAANLNAGTDQIIPIGNAATLEATYLTSALCLKITEFTLFSTGTGYTNPYPAFMTTGTFDDIVEITNTGNSAVNIGGLHLKCEGSRATDYTFPAATVPAGGVVIVTFGTAADDIPNLYFTTDQTQDVWSSGTNQGIWLTQSDGTSVIDAVATNTWTFSVASGVSATDWSGAGVSSASGYAGAGLHGADANSNANWSDANTVGQNIGAANSGLPLDCIASVLTLTWSGGNLPAPVVANPITTPAFGASGSYTFTATLSDGTCSISDDVVVEVPVPVTPVADFTVNNTTQTTGGVVSTAIFTDLSTNYPSTWAWNITGPGAVNYVDATTSASQNPHVQFGAAGLYTVELTASNLAGSDTETKTDYILVILGYCQSQASNTADEEIYSVTVNGATNAYDCSTVAPGPGSILNRYSNFTTLGSLTSMDQGATIDFTVEENECDGATYYYNGCAIWIDWNQDGIFTEPDEVVYKETTTTQSPRTITGNFVVPGTALAGETRMRITVAEGFSGTGLTPCLAYSYGETEDYVVTITAPAFKTLNLTLFLEGLYGEIAGNPDLPPGTMHEALNDLYEPQWGVGVADQVIIKLSSELDYTDVVYESVPVNLSVTGQVVLTDIPASLGDNYWITVIQRNHILTVSSVAEPFSAGTINYNFSDAVSRAYFDNLKDMGDGYFAIWGGDVNQDFIVDSGDMNPVDNDATNVIFIGYSPNDVNGDGIADSGDMNIVDNNATAIIIGWTP